MLLFTVCVVIHTHTHTHTNKQTSSIADLIQKYQVPVPCIDVSCVGECCMNNTKERIVHLHRKRYQEIAKNFI